jgi:hypothetical protein
MKNRFLTAEQVINLSLVVARIDKVRVGAPLLETQTLRASRRGALLFLETANLGSVLGRSFRHG